MTESSTISFHDLPPLETQGRLFAGRDAAQGGFGTLNLVS